MVRRGRLLMVAPVRGDYAASGRNSAYRPLRISGAGSHAGKPRVSNHVVAKNRLGVRALAQLHIVTRC
jgi:hypothetical protein